MIWLLVLIPVLTLLLFAVARREIAREVREQHQQQLMEREQWQQQRYRSPENVEATRLRLTAEIEARFAEDGALCGELKEILDEWARVRIETFHERRSWVRRRDFQ